MNFLTRFPLALLGCVLLGLCIVVGGNSHDRPPCPTKSHSFFFMVGSAKCIRLPSCSHSNCIAGEECRCTDCGLRCETLCPTSERDFQFIGHKDGPCNRPGCDGGALCSGHTEVCLCVSGCGHRCLKLSDRQTPPTTQEPRPCEQTSGNGKLVILGGLRLNRDEMCRGLAHCSSHDDCPDHQSCTCNSICGLRCLNKMVPDQPTTSRPAHTTSSGFSRLTCSINKTGDPGCRRKWSLCRRYKHRHVCGSDGRTYRTLCHFREQRTAGVDVAHRGPCHPEHQHIAAGGFRDGCKGTVEHGGGQTNDTETEDTDDQGSRECSSHGPLPTESSTPPDKELATTSACDALLPCKDDSDCRRGCEICRCFLGCGMRCGNPDTDDTPTAADNAQNSDPSDSTTTSAGSNFTTHAEIRSHDTSATDPPQANTGHGQPPGTTGTVQY
ncbi:uncharacterized protein LOC110973851 [Acanthaster planci]|uniref:Uncharacterized protein LOC110973851 n=1 Tax=Acanthaster planci TaxID=133434 RepID=A0A8B7XIS2_ACAPL|nr:uncharacterized protein LOC110973851 [Acanthaster planci]